MPSRLPTSLRPAWPSKLAGPSRRQGLRGLRDRRSGPLPLGTSMQRRLQATLMTQHWLLVEAEKPGLGYGTNDTCGFSFGESLLGKDSTRIQRRLGWSWVQALERHEHTGTIGVEASNTQLGQQGHRLRAIGQQVPRADSRQLAGLASGLAGPIPRGAFTRTSRAAAYSGGGIVSQRMQSFCPKLVCAACKA